MDDNSLATLNPSTALIVPTRSLANTVREQVAKENIAAGNLAWEAPTILLWQDFLGLLWQSNKNHLSAELGARALLTPRQASVLWTQIIEETRRNENSLVLLDVQQTVSVVERSWRLMHDWQIDAEALALDHVADTEQFLRWLDTYQKTLQKRGLFDSPSLQTALLDQQAESPFNKLVWYSYDLITAAQQQLIEQVKDQGVKVDFVAASPPVGDEQADQYQCFDDQLQELRSSFQRARELLEQDPEQRINIVIPDLQHRFLQVQEQARQIFYPGVSPYEVQQSSSVYRFSLGQALAKWPAVQSALRVISLLNNRTTVAEIRYLLRSQFVALGRDHGRESQYFERWLQQQRLHRISVDQLPELYQQCQESKPEQEPQTEDALSALWAEMVSQRQALQSRLQQQKAQNNFSALEFVDWVAEIQGWLGIWGWQTNVTEAAQNSVEHQLLQRWQDLLAEFAALSLVQKRLGLGRMLELLRQMAWDTIFQPQAEDSPILISGVFEAIGRPVDYCLLLGMDQNYPPQPQGDAFVPNRLLRERDYPDASADGSFQQAGKVVNSLLQAATNKIISYSKRNDRDNEVENHASPLFRKRQFSEYQEAAISSAGVQLESFVDTSGPAWPGAQRATGGSRIFELQSICAFRSFVSLRLGFDRDEEAEFGLDNLDRGNSVHRLMELVWGSLHSQDQLLAMSDAELSQFISETVDQLCEDPELQLSADKEFLLRLEKPRLRSLLTQWLEIEKRRPIGFSVVEREEHRTGSIGGINFSYAVDRLDVTDDGRSLIIDYKTGRVDRNDWLGERLRSPQMPLYALAHDRHKRVAVSGISYAQLQATEPKFVELCETDIVRATSHYTKRYADQWQQHRAQWPEQLESLAAEFLAGDARVNPIDENICAYCELMPVCRISQLRDQTNQASERGDTDDL